MVGGHLAVRRAAGASSEQVQEEWRLVERRRNGWLSRRGHRPTTHAPVEAQLRVSLVVTQFVSACDPKWQAGWGVAARRLLPSGPSHLLPCKPVQSLRPSTFRIGDSRRLATSLSSDSVQSDKRRSSALPGQRSRGWAFGAASHRLGGPLKLPLQSQLQCSP